MAKMTPSPRQQNIYDTFNETSQNIAVVATAGSGKTTTLLGLLDYARRADSAIFLSFSNAIVEELKTKVPAHIQARTLHSLGFEFIRGYFKGIRIQVEPEKYFRNAMGLYKEAKGDTRASLTKEEYRACRMIEQISAYARMTMTPFTSEALMEMCAYYAIECNGDTIDYSLRLLKQGLIGKGKGMWIDFVDMVWMPAKMGLKMVDRTYKVVYLDEAQDTNNAQRLLIELILGKSGRLISVGDDNQCIYGFQGANVHSFAKLRERPNTVTLPLDVTYRCPHVAVRKVKELFPDIQINAATNAIEGEEGDKEITDIQEGDLVLSRTTKPLIKLYFELVKEHKKANVVGKDMEKGLLDLAETIMAPTKEGLIIKMSYEFKKLEDSLVKKGVKHPFLHPSYEALEDKFQLLGVILDNIDDNTYQLIPTIKKIFHEEKTAAKLMTVHRSKGLENERVFIIESVKGEKLMPSKKAVMEWQHIQERNLQFVAYTRTKFGLYYLHMKD